MWAGEWVGLLEYFPSLEEGLLNLDEAARWVLEQREDRRRDDAVDVGVLDGVVGPVGLVEVDPDLQGLIAVVALGHVADDVLGLVAVDGDVEVGARVHEPHAVGREGEVVRALARGAEVQVRVLRGR